MSFFGTNGSSFRHKPFTGYSNNNNNYNPSSYHHNRYSNNNKQYDGEKNEGGYEKGRAIYHLKVQLKQRNKEIERLQVLYNYETTKNDMMTKKIKHYENEFDGYDSIKECLKHRVELGIREKEEAYLQTIKTLENRLSQCKCQNASILLPENDAENESQSFVHSTPQNSGGLNRKRKSAPPFDHPNSIDDPALNQNLSLPRPKVQRRYQPEQFQSEESQSFVPECQQSFVPERQQSFVPERQQSFKQERQQFQPERLHQNFHSKMRMNQNHIYEENRMQNGIPLNEIILLDDDDSEEMDKKKNNGANGYAKMQGSGSQMKSHQKSNGFQQQVLAKRLASYPLNYDVNNSSSKRIQFEDASFNNNNDNDISPKKSVHLGAQFGSSVWQSSRGFKPTKSNFQQNDGRGSSKLSNGRINNGHSNGTFDRLQTQSSSSSSNWWGTPENNVFAFYTKNPVDKLSSSAMRRSTKELVHVKQEPLEEYVDEHEIPHHYQRSGVIDNEYELLYGNGEDHHDANDQITLSQKEQERLLMGQEVEEEENYKHRF